MIKRGVNLPIHLHLHSPLEKLSIEYYMCLVKEINLKLRVSFEMFLLKKTLRKVESLLFEAHQNLSVFLIVLTFYVKKS